MADSEVVSIYEILGEQDNSPYLDWFTKLIEATKEDIANGLPPDPALAKELKKAVEAQKEFLRSGFEMAEVQADVQSMEMDALLEAHDSSTGDDIDKAMEAERQRRLEDAQAEAIEKANAIAAEQRAMASAQDKIIADVNKAVEDRRANDGIFAAESQIIENDVARAASLQEAADMRAAVESEYERRRAELPTRAEWYEQARIDAAMEDAKGLEIENQVSGYEQARIDAAMEDAKRLEADLSVQERADSRRNAAYAERDALRQSEGDGLASGGSVAHPLTDQYQDAGDDSDDDSDDGSGDVSGGGVFTGGGVTGGLTAAEEAAAERDDIYAYLADQFGGFSFFLQKNKADLEVGVTADGLAVAVSDPSAVSTKNVLDFVVDAGITSPMRVLGIIQNTVWYENTNASMREFDVNWMEMSEPQKKERVGGIMRALEDEAQFLGAQFDEGQLMEMAAHIDRWGWEEDPEAIRGYLIDEISFDNMSNDISAFASSKNDIMALSRAYFVPIGESDAAGLAEKIYLGDLTTDQVQRQFEEHAIAKYPPLKNAIEGGMSTQEYFAPYKYEIEEMLGRPNVDLYGEFGDVVDYLPVGGHESRPMTLGEVRKYVRGLDEWQTSDQGTNSAQSLAYAIGKTFGEVA